jgi:hypothetical protein
MHQLTLTKRRLKEIIKEESDNFSHGASSNIPLDSGGSMSESAGLETLQQVTQALADAGILSSNFTPSEWAIAFAAVGKLTAGAGITAALGAIANIGADAVAYARKSSPTDPRAKDENGIEEGTDCDLTGGVELVPTHWEELNMISIEELRAILHKHNPTAGYDDEEKQGKISDDETRNSYAKIFSNILREKGTPTDLADERAEPSEDVRYESKQEDTGDEEEGTLAEMIAQAIQEELSAMRGETVK